MGSEHPTPLQGDTQGVSHVFLVFVSLELHHPAWESQPGGAVCITHPFLSAVNQHKMKGSKPSAPQSLYQRPPYATAQRTFPSTQNTLLGTCSEPGMGSVRETHLT